MDDNQTGIRTKHGTAKGMLVHTAAFLLAFSPLHLLHAQSSPELAQIKAAAEQGEAQAQSKLADAYYLSFEFSQAAKWYRAAAEKGAAHAQYKLGEISLYGKPAMRPGATKVPAQAEEAVQWFFRAANQEHMEAQIALGGCFRDGQGVKKDLIEAYKWFVLAAKKSQVIQKVYADQLILKMSHQEIAEGDRRVASFRPNASSTSPYLSMVVLKGITGTKERRMAIINNRTFTAGEEGNVKIGTKTLRVKCLEIREKSAAISLVDTGELTELNLK